jgi:hypothetical protein
MIPFTKRERWLSVSLALALGAWALYALALAPARARRDTLARLIPEQQAQLRDLQAQSRQYTQLDGQLTEARARSAAADPNFEVMPFLETLLDRQKLTGHLAALTPDNLQPQATELAVTLELKEISWGQLWNLLSAVETAPAAVRVATLHLRKSLQNEARLDATLGLASPKPAQMALVTQMP